MFEVFHSLIHVTFSLMGFCSLECAPSHRNQRCTARPPKKMPASRRLPAITMIILAFLQSVCWTASGNRVLFMSYKYEIFFLLHPDSSIIV